MLDSQVIHSTAPSNVVELSLQSTSLEEEYLLDRNCNASECNTNRPSVEVASVTSNVRSSTATVSGDVEAPVGTTTGLPQGNTSDRGCVVEDMAEDVEWLMVVAGWLWFVDHSLVQVDGPWLAVWSVVEAVDWVICWSEAGGRSPKYHRR